MSVLGFVDNALPFVLLAEQGFGGVVLTAFLGRSGETFFWLQVFGKYHGRFLLVLSVVAQKRR